MIAETESDCCGCYACVNICPVKAIRMRENEKGFFYPRIDEQICIHCQKCSDVCPMAHGPGGGSKKQSFYAAENTDTDVLMKSSSGGIFRSLSEYVLSREGSVYGVIFDRSFCVVYARARTREELDGFYGSKYVQSCPSNMYRLLSDDLNKGKMVLLSGTPCQIKGIRAYLKEKRISDANLYCADNICHGVSSPRVWEDYFRILEEEYTASDNQIISVNMRSKHVSWEKRRMRVELQKGNLDNITDEFSFVKLYQSSLITRESCFNCPFTSYERAGDITYGDYWNSRAAGLPFSDENGISEVLINTDKGERLFHAILHDLKTAPLTKKQAWQAHLEYSAKPPKNRDQFWNEYINSRDKKAIMLKYMEGDALTQIIRKTSPLLRKTGLYSLGGRLYKAVFVHRKG